MIFTRQLDNESFEVTVDVVDEEWGAVLRGLSREG